jgi:endoglucanase
MTISVRPGAGEGGSDRVTLVWEDGAIIRQWLQVSLLASAITRLAAPDVFYFGNVPGETGDSAGQARVDYADYAFTRAAAGDGDAPIDSRFDHDRNGRVDVRDLAVVRAGFGHAALELISVPAGATTSAQPSRRPFRPAVAELGLAGDGSLLQ